MNIMMRGESYYLNRRVPKRYAAVESRKVIWLSLHTDSPTEATRKADRIWESLEHGWEARLAGEVNAEARFEAARKEAARRGFSYMPVADVAALPLEERLHRVDVAAPRGVLDGFKARAVLGGVDEPIITISRALELFWEHEEKSRTRGKSEDQIRRWKNPRMKAFRNLIDQIGDKPLADITRDDMLDFRQWWSDKIEDEQLTPNSANKDFSAITDTLNTVVEMKRLGIALPITRLALKEGEKRTRPPFSDDWIKTKLLAAGALDGLNTEARCIVLGMVNTGYRPSEAAGLLPKHIHLDGAIPYISIEPEGRALKNATSKRQIPLTGISLDAFKSCPKGFPTYFGKDKISDTVNKFLRENSLLQTPAHSLYGLRHSFEDRMIANNVDERTRRDLFGHALQRERYGNGASLQHIHETLSAFAL